MVDRINEIARYADYFLPGIGEGYLLTGKSEKGEIADYYLSQGIDNVIIKTGPEGAYAKWRTDDGYQTLEKGGYRLKEVVDTVGAGDGFAVGVITGLLENLPMEKILERANAIGAIQVSHISDNENLPTPEQLAMFIENHQTGGRAL
jgi:2-dehydro-3-deoxygluconokinase